MDNEWYYSKNGNQFGPVSALDVRTMVQSGDLTAEDMIWNADRPDWRQIGSIKGLIAFSPENVTEARISPPIQSPPSSEAVSDTGLESASKTSFIATAKAAAQIVEKQAERTKLKSMTIPKLYLALGKHALSSSKYREEFPDQFKGLDALQNELAQAAIHKDAKDNTFIEKAKATAGNALQSAQSAKLSLRRSTLLSNLGKAIYERHQDDSGPESLVAPLQEALLRLATLDSEVSELSKVGRGSWITPKRILILTIAATSMISFFGFGLLRRNHPGSISATFPKAQVVHTKADSPTQPSPPDSVSSLKGIESNTRNLTDQITQSALRQQKRNEEDDHRRMVETDRQREATKKDREERIARNAKADSIVEESKRRTEQRQSENKESNQRFADHLFGQITFDPSKRFILAKSVNNLDVKVLFSGADYEPIRKLHSERNWIALVNYIRKNKSPTLGSKNAIVTGIELLNNDSKTVAVIKGNAEFNGLGSEVEVNSKKPSLGYILFPIGVDDSYIDRYDTRDLPSETARGNEGKYGLIEQKQRILDRLYNCNGMKLATVRSFSLGSTRSSKGDGFAELLPDKTGWFFGDDFSGRYVFVAEFDSRQHPGEFLGRLTGPVVSNYFDSIKQQIQKKGKDVSGRIQLGEIDQDAAIQIMSDEYGRVFKEMVQWAALH